MKTNESRFNMVLQEMLTLYIRKNHDYGDSFHRSYQTYGTTMAAIRLGDKMNRFESLTRTDKKVGDESIRDTLIDLACYAVMTIMELDGDKHDD